MGNRWVCYLGRGDGFRVCTDAKTYQTIYTLNMRSVLYVSYVSVNSHQAKEVSLPVCIQAQ